ncbi:glycosyltransferase family 39 protein [Capillimicrobium parvum]|uniref:glycosyltransferase family 39 protein n=1 Tax=Capillimicrobium parvum TaxID=2884022 RepID=UPI00216B2C90|nr:glycosyltransferase family 39 protein [Capillimicrobium parvum]
MRRSRRIPRPLLVLLLVTLVAGLAWTYAVPALQGADESAHFGYVQKIADAGEIPWRHSETGLLQAAYPPSVSTEQWTAWLWAGLEPLRGNVAARPLWTREDERIWRAVDDRTVGHDQKIDAIGNNAWLNPPLYYLTAAVPYKIAGGTLFDRLYAMRVYGVLLLMATVALTWLLAGEVFGRRRELQTVATAAVALQPVLLDVTTRVTPDALLVPLCAGALYLMAVIAQRGPGWRQVLALVAVVVAAGFTQGRALGLVAPAVFAMGVGWWRWRRGATATADGASPPSGSRLAAAAGGASSPSGSRLAAAAGGASPPSGSRLAAAAGGASPPRGSRLAAAAGWAVAVVVVLVVVAVYATRLRFGELTGFWSYLWQFYLPKLPGMSAPVGPEWGAQQVYLDRFFGTFVQFEVGFPRDLLNLVRDLIWVGLVLLAVAAWRRRRLLAGHAAAVLVLLVAAALVILSLHAAAFRSLLVNPADPVITGRYLLMLVPLYGVAIAGAASALPGRIRAAGTGALLAGLVLLQLSAFGIVVARFYA